MIQPTQRDIRMFLNFAHKVATDAGALLKRKLHKKNKINYKGRVNLVTEADLASEKLITDIIQREYPMHSILAEENTDIDKSPDFQWIIDPLDGTTNYAHEFPVYCVSIALEYRKEVIVGAVYDPEREELFSAAKGHGAHMNRKKLHVSAERKLERGLLATGFPYDIGSSNEDNLKYFRRFAKVAQGIRRPGSAAIDLCYLAAGRYDGYWELKLSPWDTAAGQLIVKEAGGRVTDFEGKKYSIYGKYILASNGKLHNQMKKVLAG